MGSAGGSPTKKAPTKKANSSKQSTKTRAKSSKSKGGGAKSSKQQQADPTALLASASVANQQQKHLRIPTNLPVCIVDNGGWTVKYGLIPPLSSLAVAGNPAGETIAKGSSTGAIATTHAQKENNASDTKNDSNDTIPTIPLSSMYNATARPPHQLAVLAGDEITTRMKNLGQLSWNLPLERGMICDGETQLRVWARVLEVLGVVPVPMMGSVVGGGGFLASIAAARRGKPAVASMDPVAGKQQPPKTTYSSNNCAFLLLVPPFVPSVISEGVDCMLFREMGMARVARMVGPCMAAVRYLSFCQSISKTKPTDDNAENKRGWINDNTKCCCVVDSGYSFTHIVPTRCGEALTKAIRRLNVGGKVLTNLLKEAVTYRQWNMMDEYHIVNDAKEQLCFVTHQFDKEMKRARATRKGLRWFDREYLLPDFVNTFQGSVRLPEPLQRKKEMEEMQDMKRELERLQEEKEKRELAEEAKDLVANMLQQEEEEQDGKDARDGSAASDSKDKEGRKTSKHRKKSKKEKKKMKRRRKHDNKEDGDNNDGDDDARTDESGSDSDEETEQQRLQRLKAMRDAERKRREKESLDRQALAMSVERFAVPEVLFRPSDIGLDCGGVAEAIVESIESCEPMVRAAMYHNVLLVGGNAKIPGFQERVESELRKLAPTNYAVRVYLPEDPVSYAWEGAQQFVRRPGFQEHFSVDRLSWETMKKKGKTQQEIWEKRMYNSPHELR